MDFSFEIYQANDEPMSKIILIGSFAIVKQNIANGAPNAKKAHPKNSATVIVFEYFTLIYYNDYKNFTGYSLIISSYC